MAEASVSVEAQSPEIGDSVVEVKKAKVSTNIAEDPSRTPEKYNTPEQRDEAERSWIEKVGGTRLTKPDLQDAEHSNLQDDPKYEAVLQATSLRYLESQDSEWMHKDLSGDLSESGYMIDNKGDSTTLLPTNNIGAEIVDMKEAAEKDFRRLYPEVAAKYDKKSAEAKAEQKPLEDRLSENSTALANAYKEYSSLTNTEGYDPVKELELKVTVTELEEEQNKLKLEQMGAGDDDKQGENDQSTEGEEVSDEVAENDDEADAGEESASGNEDEEDQDNVESVETQELRSEVNSLRKELGDTRKELASTKVSLGELLVQTKSLADAVAEGNSSVSSERAKTISELIAAIIINIGIKVADMGKQMSGQR